MFRNLLEMGQQEVAEAVYGSQLRTVMIFDSLRELSLEGLSDFGMR